MKTFLVSLFFIVLSSSASMAVGFCTNDRLNPAMQQACQWQGQSGKGVCVSTIGCRWITTESVGICKNDSRNPGMAGACKYQGENGGEAMCKMTTGCRWIAIDD